MASYALPTNPPMISWHVRRVISGNIRNIKIFGTVACAGCVLSVGSLLLYRSLKSNYEQDIAALRKEVESLKQIISRDNQQEEDFIVDSVIGLLKNSADTNSFSTETENFAEVYFDAPEKELEYPSDPFLKELFCTIDNLLLVDCDENRIKSYNLLHQAYPQYKDNWEFLWRYARSTFLYGQSFVDRDQKQRLKFLEEAKTLIYEAYKLQRHNAEVHKWCASILGVLSDFVTLKQRIQDGAAIKRHIDKALELQPSDFHLHHLCGRWCYNVAALSWIERKLAKTLFNFQVPSFDEALSEFLKAERLRPIWHENLLYIIKCYVGKNDYQNARIWVQKANDLDPLCIDDVAAKKEIDQLVSTVLKN